MTTATAQARSPIAPQHVDVKPYMYVFAGLLCLTVATVLVSYFDWSPWLTIFIGLAIATVKASLVATFFMHLKGERVIIYGLLGLCAVFVAVLFAIPITDSQANMGRRQPIAVVVEEAKPAAPALPAKALPATP